MKRLRYAAQIHAAVARRHASSAAPGLPAYAAMQAARLETTSSSAAHVQSLLSDITSSNVALDRTISHSLLKALAIHPDAVTRSYLISLMRERWITITTDGWHDIAVGYLREGQIEKCLEAIDGMKQEGHTVLPWLKDMVLCMLCEMREVEEAFELLKERIRDGETVTAINGQGGPPLKTDVWYYFFDTACSLLHFEALKFTWQQQVIPGYINPSSGQCLAVLHAAARHADIQLATDVFRLLSTRATSFESQHYELLIEAYVRAGDMRTALTIICIMQDAGVPPRDRATQYIQRELTLQSIASQQDSTDSNYIEDRDGEAVEVYTPAQEALDILQGLRNSGRKVPITAFNTVLCAITESQGLLAGIIAYKECHQIAEAPNVHTFNELLRACRPTGGNSVPAAPSYPAISNALNVSMNDHKDVAVFLASEMAALRIRPTMLTYDRLILVFLDDSQSSDMPSETTAESLRRRQEDFDGAMRYFEEMRSTRHIPRRGTYDELVRAACRLGDERAWMLVESLSAAGYSDVKSRAFLEENWTGRKHETEDTQ